MADRKLLHRMERADDVGAPLLTWLGQAGLYLRMPGGQGVLVDPYLSDDCESLYGLRRLTPAPFTAEEVSADLVLVTHWHEDHLDASTIRPLAREETRFVGPASCCARFIPRGAVPRQTTPLAPGESLKAGQITVTATPARHEVPGYLTEDAIGFLLDLGGFVLYNVGDTEYDRRLLASATGRIDLCVIPINGSGGNIDAYEAAFLTARLDCGAVLPAHFGMWDDAGYGEGATLDPTAFADAYRTYGGTGNVIVPRIGEILVLDRPIRKMDG